MNQFIGQFHPALVHLPIGILIIALVFKLLSLRKDGDRYSTVLPVLVGSALICSLASALSGYLLSLTGGYKDDLLNNHKWAGFALTFLSALLYFFVSGNRQVKYQNYIWGASAILLLITGHLGGQLTHGEDYLNFSFRKYQKPIIKNIDSALVYRDIIEPILADKCWSCHSARKQKGSLRLDGLDHILKGGKHGDIVSTALDQSKMYHRLTLPKSTDEHMPPSGQPQPTAEEVKLIGWWLENGVTKEIPVYQAKSPIEIQSILTELMDDAKVKADPGLPKDEIAPADPHVLALLNKAGIQAIPIALNSNYLNVILNASSFKSSQCVALNSISKNIAWLSARKISIDDTTANFIGSLNHLIKLDLSQSTLNNTTIQKLKSLSNLRSFNLNSTEVTEQGLTHLSGLKSLQSIYVYQSKVKKAAFSALQNSFPDVKIDTGNYKVPVFPGDTTEYTYEQLAKDKKAKVVE